MGRHPDLPPRVSPILVKPLHLFSSVTTVSIGKIIHFTLNSRAKVVAYIAFSRDLSSAFKSIV